MVVGAHGGAPGHEQMPVGFNARAFAAREGTGHLPYDIHHG
jgi:hypothetical protein